jgi:hypothetical protein
VGQARHYQVHPLAPGLVRVALQGGPARRVQLGGYRSDALQEGCRRGLKLVGQTEGAHERVELVLDEAQGLEPQLSQGLPGHLGGNEGVAVAVAADPGAKLELGQPIDNSSANSTGSMVSALTSVIAHLVKLRDCQAPHRAILASGFRLACAREESPITPATQAQQQAQRAHKTGATWRASLTRTP